MRPSSAAAAPPVHVSNDQPAAVLTTARRVVVTGLVNASADAARAACDLAEVLGAAIDFGQPDLSRPAGPTIARVGEVTAAPEEMRDRADLVILWNCDPAATHPAIAALIPARAAVVRLPFTGATAVDAARMLLHLVRGGKPPAEHDAIVTACVAAHRALEAASCVAIVTDEATSDEPGLAAWSVVHLVRAIAHRKPAFEIPLRAGDHAVAAAVSTWRYGAAGAVARADRAGGRFQPAEAAVRQLVERGEVDCVLAIGRLPDDVERAIRERAESLAVIRLADDPGGLQELLDAVRVRTKGRRP